MLLNLAFGPQFNVCSGVFCRGYGEPWFRYLKSRSWIQGLGIADPFCTSWSWILRSYEWTYNGVAKTSTPLCVRCSTSIYKLGSFHTDSKDKDDNLNRVCLCWMYWWSIQINFFCDYTFKGSSGTGEESMPPKSSGFPLKVSLLFMILAPRSVGDLLDQRSSLR